MSQQSFIRKSKAHDVVGVSRQTLYECLQRCKKNNDPMPPLRKHKHMEVYGYKREDLIDWWYENETEVVA